MTHAARMARDDTITEALRAVNDAIGNEEPTDQAFRIIAAVKALRQPARVTSLARVDYLEKVQSEAQRAHIAAYGYEDSRNLGQAYDAIAGIETPLGRLKCLTWRRQWSDGRIAWASEYSLNDEPITVAEIKAAGLAQRPTTRNRQKAAGDDRALALHLPMGSPRPKGPSVRGTDQNKGDE